MMQPDTGICIIIVFNIFILVCCSGIRKEYVIGIFAFLAIVVGIFLFLYFEYPEILSSFISSYKLQRIDAWLEPESNIRGSSNQLYTALLSLGSAGLTGYGLQANIISIPEAHTDFIFAAFGQCFGFIGTTFILILCLLLDIYLCKIAYATKIKRPIYRCWYYCHASISTTSKYRYDCWLTSDYRNHITTYILWW